MTRLRLGAIFPQTEIQKDAGAVKAYAQAVEGMGYDFIGAFDHVLGANPGSRRGWRGVYDVDDSFFEPFALFSFMASITERVEFCTGVLILPQRQTALVAKQAATLDVLSGGRLRLGVGIGWNSVEYEALGEEFGNRGLRSEEQIDLMRKLWTNRSVNFDGRWHSVTDAGINPLPIQRPIPIWLGGGAEPLIRRVARIADGWIPQFQPDTHGKEILARMRQYAADYGRDPASIGLEGGVSAAGDDTESWVEAVERWSSVGATHVGIRTMGNGLRTADQHIERLRQLKSALDG